MKAVVLKEPGGLDALQLEEIATPAPQAGEVRVKLMTSALNRRDYWITKGMYPALTLPCVSGSDGAGVVDALGAGVDESLIGNEVVIYPARAWGDEQSCSGPEFRVLGMPDQGTFAEYICVPASDVLARPQHLDWEQAAAVPLAGLTSWRAVRTQAEVQAGQTVLITAAGSGVSTFAIQWCIKLGAKVYVTSGSREKLDKAKQLGVADGVNYRDADFAQQLHDKSGGFDAIIDGVGGDGMNALLGTLNPAGRYVFFGATLGDAAAGLPMARLFFRQIRIQGTTMGSPAEFKAMLGFLNEHKLEPVVDQVLPMDELVAAHKLLESSAQMGKIVLRNE